MLNNIKFIIFYQKFVFERLNCQRWRTGIEAAAN